MTETLKFCSCGVVVGKGNIIRDVGPLESNLEGTKLDLESCPHPMNEKVHKLQATASSAGIPSDLLTSEDVAYLKWSREMEPVRCTILFARSVSVATSTQNTESKPNANEPESIAEKQFNVRKEAKRFCGRVYLEIIDKDNEKTKGKERFVVYDQFDGESMDSKQALDPNHDDYITAAHIIPDKAVSNEVLLRVLNEGFQEKYDVNCLRNIILIKNKYSAALEAHKLGIAWNQEDGYLIKVGVNAMKEFGDLDGKPLLFFEGGIQTKNPKYPPYRRSCAYSYLSVIHRIDTIYDELRKLSMTEKEEEVKDAEQESMKTAAQEQAAKVNQALMESVAGSDKDMSAQPHR